VERTWSSPDCAPCEAGACGEILSTSIESVVIVAGSDPALTLELRIAQQQRLVDSLVVGTLCSGL
jgi:hypothetical protein